MHLWGLYSNKHHWGGLSISKISQDQPKAWDILDKLCSIEFDWWVFFGQQSTLLISWTIIIHELGVTINKPMCLWNHCKHILHPVGHWGAPYLKTYQDLSGFYHINLGDTTLSTININKPDSCEIHNLSFDVQRDTAKAFPPNSWTCSNLDHLSAYQWVKAPVKYPFQEKVGSKKTRHRNAMSFDGFPTFLGCICMSSAYEPKALGLQFLIHSYYVSVGTFMSVPIAAMDSPM